MTNEQINRAIAEACGWTDILERTSPPGFKCRPTGTRDGFERKQIPNYVHDLNDMRDAERVLNEKQYIAFMTHLGKRSKKRRDIWQAPACHRAEALLRALGKWREAQQ